MIHDDFSNGDPFGPGAVERLKVTRPNELTILQWRSS